MAAHETVLVQRTFFAQIAWRPSFSARTATVDIAIAALNAANAPDASNGGGPINVINAARKGGWIIETGNATTGNDAKNARA